MNHISVEDTDTWLNLLCRYSTELSLCLIPSPEEFPLIVRSENPGPDVVRYAPCATALPCGFRLHSGLEQEGPRGIHDTLPAVCHVLDTSRC